MLKTKTETLSCKSTSSAKRGSAGVGGSALAPPRHAKSGLVLLHTKGEKTSQSGFTKEHFRKAVRQNNVSFNLAFKQKLILYGNKFDLYNFTESIYFFESTREDFSKSSQKNRRSDSLSRTRNNVVRIIECNTYENPLFRPVFLTLTFAQNIRDIKTANLHFKNFIKRLNYQLNFKAKYICVIEFQRRGAVHYHLVFFNLPFVPKEKVESIWSHGFTRIEMPRNINDVSRYVGKYMSKELLDKRLVGQKAFFTSRGIIRPRIIYQQTDIDKFVNSVSIKLLDQFETSSYTIKKYQYEVRTK